MGMRAYRRRGAAIAPVVALIAVALLAVGCAGSAAPEPTPTPTPINPQAVLDESGAVMAALSSFRFRVAHSGEGGTRLAPGFTLTEVSGAYEAPDSIALDYVGAAGGFAVRGSVAAVGDAARMTNPLTGDWVAVDARASPLNFFSPARGIADLMARVRQPTLAAHNAARYRIEGMLPVAALAALFGDATAAGEGSVRAALTIDRARLRLTEAVLTGRIAPDEPAGIERVITLSDFDEPQDIGLPE